MGKLDISLYVLKEVVAGLGPVFSTYDVSEDVRMTKAHLNLADDKLYNRFVGEALSFHRAKLKIVETGKRSSRGTQWKKI